MTGGRGVACKFSCRKHVAYIVDKLFRYILLAKDGSYILFVQFCSRDGKTVAEVAPSRAFYLQIESVPVVSLEGGSCCFETFLRYLVRMFVPHTVNVCILFNLLAQHNQQHNGNEQWNGVEQQDVFVMDASCFRLSIFDFLGVYIADVGAQLLDIFFLCVGDDGS